MASALTRKKKNKSDNSRHKQQVKHLRLKRRKRIRRKLWRRKHPILVWFLKWGFIGGVWAGIMLSLIIAYYAHDLPDIDRLTAQYKTPTVTIISEKGVQLASLGDLYGDYVHYRDFPPQLIQAVMATEDRRFFQHFGIDVIGLARAFYTNFRAGHVVQGGSTITQQLAKIIFLNPQRTMKRKIQEMLLAFWLESNLTKEQIMTIYLNRVYMGAGNYGMDAASRYYFNKPIRKINYYEAATLAGMLKAPARYAPTNNHILSEERANEVVMNMIEAGYLTTDEAITNVYSQTMSQPAKRGALRNPYFADWIMEILPEYVGNVTTDLTVVSTMDPVMQHYAEEAMNQILDERGKDLNFSQGALVAMSPDGAVRAMIGGRDYSRSPFNRAVNAQRQPGSLFKLIDYAAAFDKGIFGPNSVVRDAPIQIGKWRPHNYKNQYLGAITLREAFAKSINTTAVRVAMAAGWENVVEMARRLGITSPLTSEPSISLGSYEINLLEMTQAFAHIANNGKAVRAYGIQEIRDDKGNIIYTRSESEPAKALKTSTVEGIKDIMSQVIKTGTGHNANFGRPAAAKTGTSQNYRDAWMIGFVPQLVAGVWVGNDNNSPMKEVTGGKIPAVIWRLFMEQAVKDMPIEPLTPDPNAPPPSLLTNSTPLPAETPQQPDLAPKQEAPAAILEKKAAPVAEPAKVKAKTKTKVKAKEKVKPKPKITPKPTAKQR